MPVDLSRREFIRLVRRAYQQLPPRVREALDNVDVVVEEWPNSDELAPHAGETATLFGLYTGVPLPEREGGGPFLPDLIIIYRQPILRHCSTPAEVEQEVRVTLWHEVGHYLGIGEEGLHRLGYG